MKNRRMFVVREATGAVGKLFQKHDEIRSDYNEKQRHTAEDLTMSGVKIRILSFMLDSIFMFWPSFLFIISLLLLTSPANIRGSLINNIWELTVIYILSILCFNTGSAVYWMGQTFGMRYYQLKIVKKDNSEASVAIILLRELCGVSIPWVMILLSFNMFNLAVFSVLFLSFLFVNFVFIVIDRRHRSIIDLFLGTKLVFLPDVSEEGNEAENTEETPNKEEVRVKTVKEEIEEKIANTIKEAESVIELDIPTHKEKEKESEADEKKTPKLKSVESEVEQNVKKDAGSVKEVPHDEETVQKEEDPDTKKKELKEKSVTEIISEAVSVVDQALESKKEVYPVKIEKPARQTTEQAEETTTELPKETKPAKPRKNVKKKNRSGQRPGGKKAGKPKNVKPAAKNRKPSKKKGKGL